MTLLLLGTVGLLAWANGANDNFKGVASLRRVRGFTYRKALLWATAFTLGGSLAGAFLARGLLPVFSSASVALGAAALGGAGVAATASWLRDRRTCICAAAPVPAPGTGGVAVSSAILPALVVDTPQACAVHCPKAARFDLADAAHWASGAFISFSRGLQDTPKLVALVALSGLGAFAGVGTATGFHHSRQCGVVVRPGCSPRPPERRSRWRHF